MTKNEDIGGVWRTIGGRRIFIQDGQGLASAMKESGKFKKNGADSKKINVPTHSKPKKIGKLYNMDESNIRKILESYENKIRNEKIENAIVITKDGIIYQCFGIEDGVYPDVDLEDKIRGGYITHNHPANQTYYGFSNQDNNLFKKYDLKILRGVDDKYTYEYNRNKKGGAKMPNDMDSEYGYEHLMSIKFAQQNDIYYDRWEN